jgi:hypothetical protein
MVYQGKDVKGKGGKGGKASAESGNPEAAGIVVHKFPYPQTIQYANQETAYYIDDKGAKREMGTDMTVDQDINQKTQNTTQKTAKSYQ